MAFALVYNAVITFWHAFTASSVFEGVMGALEWVLERNSDLVNACVECGAVLQDFITWAVSFLPIGLLGL